MKKLLLSTIFTLSSLTSVQTLAETGWGGGCNYEHSTITYVYVSNDSIFSITGGGACFITSITDPSVLPSAAAILSEAMASGKPATISFNETSLSVSMNQ